MTELAISSVGPPHPLHADRVIALMTRHLVDRARHIRDALKDIAFNANDGSPPAQHKLAQRLIKAGTVLGHQTVCTGLSPGKRGRYTIRMLFWSGWDKARDREIGVDDPLPFAYGIPRSSAAAARVWTGSAPHSATSRPMF